MSSNYSMIFFTADVASLLKIPEWRVIKFAMGSEYEIKPSHSDAAGSGTRRVYDIEDVCDIALAVRLLDAGLSSKAIGRILRALRGNEPLSSQLTAARTELKMLYLVVFRTSKLRARAFGSRKQEVRFTSNLFDVQNEHAERLKDELLLISVGSTFRSLQLQLRKCQKEKRQ